MIPSPRVQHSRAAAVSAALRKAGFQPMPSGSTRNGLLRVRPSSDRVLVVVDLTLHGEAFNTAMLEQLRSALTGRGYVLLPQAPADEGILLIRVKKESW